jgi:hypothetical protein
MALEAKAMNSQKNKFNAPNDCGRKEDLVDYLYDEAGATERASFERHLEDCESCRNELSAFGRVRDELSAWQIGLAPRSEIVLQRSKLDALRELIGMFPIWVRGAALAGATAAMLLLALSASGASVSLRNGDFAIRFGATEKTTTGASPVSSKEVERLVQNAVAREREKIEQQYSAQLASFKDRLSAEHQEKLQAVVADHQIRLEAAQAELKREIQRTNRQNASIRSFFAMDDVNDPWGDVR